MSGGLLVACAPEIVDRVLGEFRGEGFIDARRIGQMRPGPAMLAIE